MKNNSANTYLSFRLGDELFGANVESILEVLLDEEITSIPKSKNFIKGIVNFRGEIVTVINLLDKVNIAFNDKQEKSIIVVFEIFTNEKNIKVGVLVQNVQKVFTLSANELLPIPEFGKYYNPEYLIGVTKVKDEFVLLLDIEKVLNDEEVQLILDKNK